MGQLIGAAIGGGKFTTNGANINQQDFQNPVGNQSGNWNTGMSNMLGTTTGAAPQGTAATAQGAQLNSNQFNQSYGQEQGLAGQYAQMAAGQGPSLATVTANQQAQQGLNNTLASLGSQSGSSNPALAQRAAIDAGSNAQAQAASNAVQGRTQEELGAMNAQAGLYGNMNQQAMGMANANAQLSQQSGQFNASAQNQMAIQNLQAALQNKQINNQQYNQYMNMLQAQNLAQFNANQQSQQLNVQNALGAAQINSGAQQNYENNMGQGFNTLIGGNSSGNYGTGIIGGASSLSTVSDIRSKKNIKSASNELDVFLNHINSVMKARK